jgi:di/tricarboxylate transporter
MIALDDGANDLPLSECVEELRHKVVFRCLKGCFELGCNFVVVMILLYILIFIKIIFRTSKNVFVNKNNKEKKKKQTPKEEKKIRKAGLFLLLLLLRGLRGLLDKMH